MIDSGSGTIGQSRLNGDRKLSKPEVKNYLPQLHPPHTLHMFVNLCCSPTAWFSEEQTSRMLSPRIICSECVGAPEQEQAVANTWVPSLVSLSNADALPNRVETLRAWRYLVTWDWFTDKKGSRTKLEASFNEFLRCCNTWRTKQNKTTRSHSVSHGCAQMTKKSNIKRLERTRASGGQRLIHFSSYWQLALI